MRNLADTIARLAANRNRSFAPPSTGSDALTGLTGFGSNPGQLDALIHVPDNLARNAPLVVVLHGCTQTAAGYDHAAGWSRLADREGFAVLYPQQRRANNANLCFNWFVPGDIGREGGEAHSIRQMIEAAVVAHGIDRDRIFVTGLSAGGAMAGVMLAAYPDTFAAGAIIAGLPYGTATSVPEAFDRMRGHGAPDTKALQKRLAAASGHSGAWPRISVWQGSADQTVAASNAGLIVNQWQGVHGVAGQPTREEEVDGHRRMVWVDDEGREAIEYYLIQGMSHGTPLDTADGLSHAAPYMIDAGISSTLRIAGFFGLVDEVKARTAGSPRPATATPSTPRTANRSMGQGAKTAAQPQPETASAGVRHIIEDALRKAGLLK